MKNHEKPETVIGQPHENNATLSSPESSPKKSGPSKCKAQDDGPSPKSSIQTPKSRKRTTTKSSVSEAVSGSKITLKKSKPKSLMPVLRMPSPKKRGEGALKRLRIDEDELARAPQITPTIKSCVKGGLNAALDAMRFANEDPEIRAFLEFYDEIPPEDRRRVSWEAICVAAKINPKHLMSSALLAVTSYCATRSRFIMVSHHPEITQKRIEYAKLAGGERDRTQLDIMVGALPSAKGPTFIGKAVFGAPGASPAAQDDDDEPEKSATPPTVDDTYNNLFPSINEIQDKLIPIRQKRLED